MVLVTSTVPFAAEVEVPIILLKNYRNKTHKTQNRKTQNSKQIYQTFRIGPVLPAIRLMFLPMSIHSRIQDNQLNTVCC